MAQETSSRDARPTDGSRANGAVITSPPDISSVWPQVFDSVVATLRRRGIGLHSAEDATQEAGSRVLTNGIGFTDADDLRRWVQTVAWRVAIDENRRMARHDGGGNVVDMASFQEVPAEVENRLRLAATTKAWRALSPADRKAIVGDGGEAGGLTRTEAVKLNVRRHRARARLLALVEGVAALVVVSYRRLRRAPAVAVLATVLPITALILPFVGDAPGGDDGGVASGPPGAASDPVENVRLADAAAAGSLFDSSGSTLVPQPEDETPSSSGSGAGRRLRGPSPLDNVDQRVDTPMPDDKDPYFRTEPKEHGAPLACASTPATPRTCTPPLPVEVPAPPQPPGVDL